MSLPHNTVCPRERGPLALAHHRSPGARQDARHKAERPRALSLVFGAEPLTPPLPHLQRLRAKTESQRVSGSAPSPTVDLWQSLGTHSRVTGLSGEPQPSPTPSQPRAAHRSMVRTPAPSAPFSSGDSKVQASAPHRQGYPRAALKGFLDTAGFTLIVPTGLHVKVKTQNYRKFHDGSFNTHEYIK